MSLTELREAVLVYWERSDGQNSFGHPLSEEFEAQKARVLAS